MGIDRREKRKYIINVLLLLSICIPVFSCATTFWSIVDNMLLNKIDLGLKSNVGHSRTIALDGAIWQAGRESFVAVME